MKIIKYLLLLVLLVLIGAAVYIATKDGDYQVEESKMITAPDELLFNSVSEYKTWEAWNPWLKASNDFILSYKSTSTGKGSGYSWKSESQGDGSMTTTNSIPFTIIDQRLNYIFPFPVGETESTVYWKFEKIEPGKTKITWGMKGKQSFMEKAFWETQDSTVSQSMKPMLIKGLANLETFAQKKMEAYAINVDGVTEQGGGFYMYNAAASSIAAIPSKMSQMKPAVKAYMSQNKLVQTGQPFTLYNEYNEDQGTAIFSIGIPTREKVVTPKDSPILCGFIPRQKVVKTTLNGDRKNLKEAWEAAYKYIADNNLELDTDASAQEVYRVEPEIQPNPAELITEIYIPIK